MHHRAQSLPSPRSSAPAPWCVTPRGRRSAATASAVHDGRAGHWALACRHRLWPVPSGHCSLHLGQPSMIVSQCWLHVQMLLAALATGRAPSIIMRARATTRVALVSPLQASSDAEIEPPSCLPSMNDLAGAATHGALAPDPHAAAKRPADVAVEMSSTARHAQPGEPPTARHVLLCRPWTTASRCHRHILAGGRPPSCQ